MTYPSTWHTKFMTYPNTSHTLMHDRSISFLHFLPFTLPGEVPFTDWAYSPHFSKVLILCCRFASYMYLTSLRPKYRALRKFANWFQVAKIAQILPMRAGEVKLILNFWKIECLMNYLISCLTQIKPSLIFIC
jgi:signal transduction histidine kinase